MTDFYKLNSLLDAGRINNFEYNKATNDPDYRKVILDSYEVFFEDLKAEHADKMATVTTKTGLNEITLDAVYDKLLENWAEDTIELELLPMYREVFKHFEAIIRNKDRMIQSQQKAVAEKNEIINEMRTPLIQYCFFDSNEDFTKWQIENPVKVVAVQPIIQGIDMAGEQEVDSVEVNGQTSIRIFVTYVAVPHYADEES